MILLTLQLLQFLPWIKCRMLFMLLPMFLQIFFLILFPFVTSTNGVIVVMACTAIASSTLFSGSVITVNYELDPHNSGMVCSVFNSFGQTSGFLGPLLVSWITTTDPDIEDYEEVYKRRWNYYFFMLSGFAGVGVMAVVVAYLVWPNEWVDRSDGKSNFNETRESPGTVIENPVTRLSKITDVKLVEK